jgi:carbon-monoxide dehydrogenase medium subunit
MKPFDYIAVQSVDQACGVLAEYGSGARILAGGTDLLVELRRASSKAPRIVVDISRIVDLNGILESNGSVVLRPLTTHRCVLESNTIHRFAQLLASAASTIGSPQIRNLGTVGGNIMNAAACADTVPPLIALDAEVTLRSKNGARQLRLSDLFVKPYETKARPDEVLTEIRFSKLSPSARSAFIKLGRRNALSIARLSVAVILHKDEQGRITDARIVTGAAFPTWRRVTSAEELLVGEKPSLELFAGVGQEVSRQMIAVTGRRWSTEYKEPVVGVLVRRALEQCLRENANMKQGRPTSGDSMVPTRQIESARPSSICTTTVTVNGRKRRIVAPANKTLLDLLRDDLGLTGTKCGCEIGECGACTVLLDGKAVNSCLVLAPQIDGREVLTVEGLRKDGKLHPLQESFMDHDAVHCGFCTPGMLMSAKELLDENPRPDEKEIRTAISGNLCRCTGYVQIVEAIRETRTRD